MSDTVYCNCWNFVFNLESASIGQRNLSDQFSIVSGLREKKRAMKPTTFKIGQSPSYFSSTTSPEDVDFAEG